MNNLKEKIEKSKLIVTNIYDCIGRIESVAKTYECVEQGQIGILMPDGNMIDLNVLTDDQIVSIKKSIKEQLDVAITNDSAYLDMINSRDRKPAIINQDFEDAVQGMINSAKTPKVTEDAKTNEMDDSVELDISQGNPPETQNTEPKIEKPWLNEALLRKELVENGLGVGEFAKKYDCKKSDVYNGKSKYGINTTTVQKSTPSNAKR